MVVRYQMYQVPFVIWSIFVTSVFRNQVYFISQIQFCMLSNLQVLDLGECPPENLPNNVNHLLNLRCLILQSSKLSSLPESFCTLCKLQIPRKCSTITRRYQILKWTNRLSQVERSFNGDSKAEETWSKLLWRVTSSFLRSSSISDFGPTPNCCPIGSLRECDCHVFDYFIQQFEAANSRCTILTEKLTANVAGGVGVASSPRGWPSIFKSLVTLVMTYIDQSNFQLLPLCGNYACRTGRLACPVICATSPPSDLTQL